MKRSTCLFSILLIAIPVLIAQKPNPDAVVCNTAFARSLVAQTVAETQAIEDSDKRVQVLVRAADFIWPIDEASARNYFADAFKFATDRFADKGFEKERPPGKTFYIQLPDLRFQVIKAIAKRDSVWARRLTEQLLKEYEKSSADRPPTERSMEVSETLGLATASIKTNPELSWILFRRIMNERLDFYWAAALSDAARADIRFADSLYGELLANYQNETPRRLLFLSFYALGNDQMIGIDRFSYGIGRLYDFIPNRTLQQRFLELFFRRSIAFASDPANYNMPGDANRFPEPAYIISAAQELEPTVIRDFPQLLSLLSEAKSKASAMLSNDTRSKMSDTEKRNDANSSPFEQRLAELEKADEEGRLTDTMIMSVELKLKKEEQFKIFLPWLDKIKDEKLRGDLTSHFWVMRTSLAIDESRLTDAQDLVRKVPEIEYRSVLSFRIAEKQIGSSDNFAAARLLLDVADLANRSENSVARARVMLGLAALFEKIDHLSALNRLNDAIAAINKLESGDMMRIGIAREIRTPDFVFYVSYASPSFGLENTFDQLSKNDFSNTYSNAQALDNKYYKAITVLTVAKNCVDKLPVAKPMRVTRN